MRSRNCLVFEDVQKIVAACKLEAVKCKREVTVAVVDETGYLCLLERMDGAGPLTTEMAAGKARTAALTRRSTTFWEERVKDNIGLLKFPENLPVRGGLPILVGTDCIGGIGISGAMPNEDEQIANAGLAALK